MSITTFWIIHCSPTRKSNHPQRARRRCLLILKFGNTNFCRKHGICFSEWMSDCCLINFSAIPWREQITFQWVDKDVRFRSELYIVVPPERAIIRRERDAGAYRLSAYYMSKITSELPLILCVPLIFFSFLYWMVGIGDATLYVIFVAVNYWHSQTGLFTCACWCHPISRRTQYDILQLLILKFGNTNLCRKYMLFSWQLTCYIVSLFR
jgi:hypothetical protein